MVVTEGVNRAIEYYHAISDHIQETGLPFDVLVAFSGDRDYNGAKVTESSLNGFSERNTAVGVSRRKLPHPGVRGQVPDGI